MNQCDLPPQITIKNMIKIGHYRRVPGMDKTKRETNIRKLRQPTIAPDKMTEVMLPLMANLTR